MNRTLFALLGEVEDDPAVMDGEELLQRLGERLRHLNVLHEGCIHAPLTVSGSFPEFTGVLYSHLPVYDLSRSIAEACRPLPVRLALAKGDITTGLESADPEAMDGPAYDLAGELLYRTRKEDRLLLLDTGDRVFDDLFNALLLLMYRNFQTWTERQWEVVDLYRRYGRQREVAERLRISQQSVSSTLAGAGWKVVAEVEESLQRVLAQAGR